MSAVEEAEKSIEQLSPGEFQEFLVWLSRGLGDRLGGGVSVEDGKADREARTHDGRVRAGEAEPFRYVDVEDLPEAARAKARSVIRDWHARYGS